MKVNILVEVEIDGCEVDYPEKELKDSAVEAVEKALWSASTAGWTFEKASVMTIGIEKVSCHE